MDTGIIPMSFWIVSDTLGDHYCGNFIEIPVYLTVVESNTTDLHKKCMEILREIKETIEYKHILLTELLSRDSVTSIDFFDKIDVPNEIKDIIREYLVGNVYPFCDSKFFVFEYFPMYDALDQNDEIYDWFYDAEYLS